MLQADSFPCKIHSRSKKLPLYKHGYCGWQQEDEQENRELFSKRVPRLRHTNPHVRRCLVDHYQASLGRVARLSRKADAVLSPPLASRTPACRASRAPQCAGAESGRGASRAGAGPPIRAAGRWKLNKHVSPFVTCGVRTFLV